MESVLQHHTIRRAVPEDASACVHLRGMTRENAVSVERLRAYGITEQSWAEDIRSNILPGHVCHAQGRLVGYAFGDRQTGEVVVLALLPEAESQGLGRRLLTLVVEDLRAAGHARLFLGCSPDAATRSHGFYRHLGWRSTGTFDRGGDEVLELSSNNHDRSLEAVMTAAFLCGPVGAVVAGGVAFFRTA
jgi:GNAT superfamily N-acetyltransferase